MANEEKTIITPTDLYGIKTKLPVKTSAKAPTLQETQESAAKELRTKILSRATEGKVSINAPPMYLKPTFLLDSLTPYIKVQIILPKNSINEFEYIDLFDSEENQSHSFLKSMKYDVMPKGGDTTSTGGGNLVITLTSVNQEIIEILAMRFTYLHRIANSNPPKILVDFGWSVSPELKRQYKDSCSFTTTISGPLGIGDVVFNKDGSIEATLSCTVDQTLGNFPAPYNGYLPKEIVGPYPGVTVALYMVLKKFDKMFPKEAGQKNSTIPEKDIRSNLLLFILTHLTKSRNKIIELYKNVVKNYLGDCTVKDSELLKELNNIGILKKGGIYTIKEKGPTIDNTDIITNFINDLNELEGNQRSKILQYVLSLQKVNSDFIQELVPSVSEMYIHPYLVFEYLKRSFENGLKNSEAFKDIAKDVQMYVISLVPEENIYPLKYITKTKISKEKEKDEYKTNINQQEFDKLQQADKEKYGVKATAALVLSNGTSWPEAFQELERKMYAAIDVTKEKNIYNEVGKEITKNKNTRYGRSTILEAGEKKLYIHSPLNTKVIYLSSKDEAISKINHFIKYLIADKKERTEQKSGIEKILNEISLKEKDKGIFLFVRDITPGAEIFSLEKGGITKIIQAYSILTNGNPNNYKDNFNPGYPTVWDISFPDVLDFSPTFNFLHLLQGLKTNQKISMNISHGTKKIDSLKNILLKDGEEGGEAIKKALENWKKANKNKTELDPKKDKVLIEKIKKYEAVYKEYQDVLSEKRFDPFRQAYKDTHPVCLDLDFKQKDSYTGDYSGTIEMKRTLQNFRKALLFENKSITGTLRVLGDPIFSVHDVGKYIFLKVFMPDGSLSFFTGLYVIQSPITHEISPGKFETTLNITTENIATDEAYGLELTEAIYGQDRIQVSIQE